VPTAELLEQFGLTGLERRQTGGLSGGQKRRLVVAVAFVGRPERDKKLKTAVGMLDHTAGIAAAAVSIILIAGG